MTGFIHNISDLPLQRRRGPSDRCLCKQKGEDTRQKYLDPVLLFSRDKADNRITHFVQPGYAPIGKSEYRREYRWPTKKHPVEPYVAEKDPFQQELQIRVHPEDLPYRRDGVEPASPWSRGVTDRIFEKRS